MRLLAVTALLALAQAKSSPPCTSFSPTPIPFSDLAAFFPYQPSTLPTLLASEDIRQALSAYVLAIDTRAFDQLPSIFTPTATANYSAPLGVFSGVDALQTGLAATLAPFPHTQHLLGLPRIRVCGSESAISATYYQAMQVFASNVTAGATKLDDDKTVLYSYGVYQDSWTRKGGSWRIRHRNLVYTGPLISDIE